jgi:hypothetical protein
MSVTGTTTTSSFQSMTLVLPVAAPRWRSQQ